MIRVSPAAFTSPPVGDGCRRRHRRQCHAVHRHAVVRTADKKPPFRTRTKINPASFEAGSSGAGRPQRFLVLDPVLAGNVLQLAQDAGVELPDALLGDAELVANLLERHAAVVVKAVTHADDLLLARLEI